MGNAIIFKTVTFSSRWLSRLTRVGRRVVVTLVCGLSRDFRVCRRAPRRVPNRTRVGVFCT